MSLRKVRIWKSLLQKSLIYLYRKQKIAVWKKLVDRRDYLDTLGYDICGKLINFNDYRDTKSIHRWEIDLINPVSNGDLDNIENLQGLFWRTYREKGDIVGWKCKMIF